MTERCAVCGRECERTVSIFVSERGRYVSKYACPECDRAWLAANAPKREYDPKSRRQLTLLEAD